jgi:hypothetical protein
MRQYFAPLQRHLRLRHRLGVEAAEEVVQDFMVRKVLALRLIARADQGRGRFRTYLLTALDHFALNTARARRIRQGVPLARIAEPAAAAASLPHDERRDPNGAHQMIQDALRVMAEECLRAKRSDIWDVFYARLVAPMLYDCQPLPYDQIVQRFGFDSPAQACNVLVTAKRSFVRALRTVIRRRHPGRDPVQDRLGNPRWVLAVLRGAGARQRAV